jgi:hypothetical protein
MIAASNLLRTPEKIVGGGAYKLQQHPPIVISSSQTQAQTPLTLELKANNYQTLQTNLNSTKNATVNEQLRIGTPANT